jgi:hypothetical protein
MSLIFSNSSIQHKLRMQRKKNREVIVFSIHPMTRTVARNQPIRRHSPCHAMRHLYMSCGFMACMPVSGRIAA